MADWLTPAAARADWADAPADNTVLERYLAAAKVKVLAYAPELAEGVPTPDNYVLAQQALVRDLWNALHAKVNTQMDSGLDQYTVAKYPMSLDVKDLLRPPTVRANWLVG